MIETRQFIDDLRERGVSLFVGVPDSLLKSLSAYLFNAASKTEHIITANEGNAIGMAMGHYMATGTPAMVYMQNSGLGNTINPIASLADPAVYGVPMLLIVGWRGEPGIKDEPQHVKQGEITEGQLELLDVPHWIVDQDTDMTAVMNDAWKTMIDRSGPVALLVKAKSFDSVKLAVQDAPQGWHDDHPPLYREEAIDQILSLVHEDDCIIATTGKTGRELFELRELHQQKQCDFLTVGGMGHTASIALGVALAQPERRVICLDGDGSMLMHMGASAIIGDLKPKNFVHVLLNNQAHESVGGQPTVAYGMDFAKLADACGYTGHASARTKEGIAQAWKEVSSRPGPNLLEIHLWTGSRDDLGRPTKTPAQNKQAFMSHLGVK